MIKIKDADTFFQSVQHHVESLEEFAKPHPLSIESAVVSLKRYVSEPRYHIKLADLINDTVERAIDQTSTQKLTMQNIQNPTDELVRKYMGIFDSAFAILQAIGINGGAWVEKEHYEYWLRALLRLSSVNNLRSGPTVWIELQRYPGMLLFYALGVGALEYKRLDFISHLFNFSIYNIDKGGNITAVQLLPAGAQEVLSNAGMAKSRAPLSDWIYTELRKYTKNLIPDEATSILAFDKLELLMALGYAFHAKETSTWYRAPMGGFGYRYQNGDRILKEIEKSVADDKDESIYVKACIFGENTETCTQGLHAFREYAAGIWRSSSFR